MPNPHPGELTFEESLALLAQIPKFGSPMPQLILTGGDPLARPDLFLLIEEAERLGIGVSITPAATPALTRDVLARLKAHGVDGLGLSLDGSSASRHDSIRGVAGTFDRTLQAIEWAGELHLPLQVNTLVSAETAGDIPATYELLKQYDVMRWSLFFLISVGRGKMLQPLSPEEGTSLMDWVYQTSRVAPFVVATTEAPSYRRFALEKLRAEGLSGEQIKSAECGSQFRNPRWARHHVRFQYRRYLSGRISSRGGRKRSHGSHRGCVPRLGLVPIPARPDAVCAALRTLPASYDLRWISIPSLRGDRKSAGVGPLLWFPTAHRVGGVYN
jgi:MoaA/NifB/PqqE/SkfB family radical SAM enzyme